MTTFPLPPDPDDRRQVPLATRPYPLWLLGAVIAYAGTAWLGIVETAGGSASGWAAAAWLRDATVALPGVMLLTLLAVLAAGRSRRGPDGSGPLAMAAVLAAAGALALAAARTATSWLFDDGELSATTAAVTALVGLPVTLVLARLFVGLPARRRLPVLRPGRRAVVCASSLTLVAGALVVLPSPPRAAAAADCARVVIADVVALDEPIHYNRLGTVNPAGMIYALRRDVVAETGTAPGPGNAKLREDKRPRPLTLRVNVGDCLEVRFENLLDPQPLGDQPATREAGVHVTGMQLAGSIGDDGSSVGENASSLIGPGETGTYRYVAEREGAYVLSSTADNVSGEALTGTTAFGLFGAVNVEPRGSEWYRSQVTRAEMDLATEGTTASGHPVIDYEATYPAGHPFAGLPVLDVVRPVAGGLEIVHSDLNAIITGPDGGAFPSGTYRANPTYPKRNQPFREFTVVFHDEIKAIQAFGIFGDPQFRHTLHGVKDGFAINYGAAGAGAEIVANRLGVGPMAECVDCKYEEFFLTSWAVGDPAMVVDVPANADGEAAGRKATRVHYPDDPSNVHHSYLNDHVKFRNLHVGKEHHIFHLHAHQWLATPDDDNSTYLDSQAIGPGTSFTYEVAHNGSGNRNKTAGDSIFHCHFYPHFAQGMWALWRVHDTFERGTELDGEGRPAAGSRALPDAEIAAGTPIPGIVPLPILGMAPMPAGDVSITDGQVDLSEVPEGVNPGYPFWIPGTAGHRPPTPPMDVVDDGGLPRHVITGGAATATTTPYDFDKVLTSASALFLPEQGTPVERAAMTFHAQRFHTTPTPAGTAPGTDARFEANGLPAVRGAPFADPCRNDNGTARQVNRRYQGANIQLDMRLNKDGWHFPQSRIIALWQDVAPTLAGTRPPEPFVMRANSGDCVEYLHTNLVPHVYEQDAFQVRTPTDVIGQHIHLVKFDVTSADGSGNGFNYEDGTLAPAEVRERIEAIHAGDDCTGTVTDCSGLTARSHPFFGAGPNGAYLGARTTVQRWWADPVLNNAGRDRGLGSVYTHDHYGPSTHQQVGLYGTLLIEPAGSQWRNPETGALLGSRSDGGPTSWRADILPPNSAEAHREFYFEFQDFQLAYEAGRGVDAQGRPIPDPTGAVNPPSKEDVGLPDLIRRLGPGDNCPQDAPHTVGTRGCPEAISAADVGTFTVNYRNEPLALRVRDPGTNGQAAGQAGDLSLAFSSRVQRADADFNRVGPYPPLTADVGAQDPFTPLMRVYDSDRVNIRVQVGATEEGHNATMHGLKWLQEYASANSGWRNGQMLGISEQFQLIAPIAPRFQGQPRPTADYLYAWSSSVDGLWNGAWGLMRSYSATQNNLLALPNNPINSRGLTVRNLNQFNGVCPRTAPVTQFQVTAALARDVVPGGTLVYNGRAAGERLHDPTAILYVRTADLDPATGRLRAGVPVEPLVLRARAGDCIQVTLANRLPAAPPDLDGFDALPPIVDGFNANDVTPSAQVGLRPQLLTYITSQDEGANVGLNNTNQTVPPGGSRTYRWYAGDLSFSGGNGVATPVEFGATNLISSDPIQHSNKGAIGALVIEPAGSTWTEDAGRRASATVTAGSTSFREHVLLFQDDVNLRQGAGNGTPVPRIAGNDDVEDSGGAALNYRTEPLWLRAGIAPDTPATDIRDEQFADVLSNTAVGGDPQTPVFTSAVGQPTRLRVLQPAGHTRNHVVAVHGHSWQRTPYSSTSSTVGSTAIASNALAEHRGAQEGIGPANHFDLVLQNGAGGSGRIAGDYLIRDMTPIRFYNGTWAVLRVR